MSTTHTPGPYRVSANANGDWVIYPSATDDGYQPIATIYSYSIRDVDCRGLANARLIAAAPDLLAAAMAVVARWDTPAWKAAEPTAIFIDDLRAAIDTATGAA
jgi:hypothetical protein